MARGGFRDVFGGKPVVRVADVDKAGEPVERTGERNVKGERPKVDDMEWVLLGLSSPLFWACVEYLVAYVATFPKVGRPREHTVADWVLYWRATEIRESLRRTDDMFVSAINWRRARAVVEQMGWTEPEWLLSEWQMNRFQFDRFGKRYIGEEQIKELSRLISSNAVADARTLGQFPDSGGSRPSLTPDRVVYGDGSELKTMFNPRRKRVDPHTGEITYSRHDPDAIPHHHHLYVEDHYTGEKVCKICDFNKHRKLRSDGADGAHIYEMVTLLTRTDLRQERIVLGVGLREQHETDANKFTDMLLDLKHDEPPLTDMSLVPVYDGRLNATDIDRLQDDGNLVVCKVANDPKGKIKIRTLHDQTFTRPDGSKTVLDVHFVDGTAALKTHDSIAVEWFVKLERQKIQPNELVNSICTYIEWRVTDHPLVSKWAGAVVRVRLNSTKEERLQNRRRPVYMRVVPESDPMHPKLFGRREDSESFNATYKDRLNDARVRSVGRIRNQLNLLSFQMNENDKAMHAHFERSKDEDAYDKRFSYRPKRITKALLKAA